MKNQRKSHRDFCPRCALKHIGKAKVLMAESKLGYPHHVWFAMANLSEAEDEIVDLMPKEARAIRRIRLRLQKGLMHNSVPTINFTRLMYLVANGAMLEEVTSEFGFKTEET